MSNYILTRNTFVEVGDELAHSRRKRRYERKTTKNFKYVAKVDIGKTTRYFYTKAEYDAYLRGNKTSKQIKTPVVGSAKKANTSAKNSGKPNTTFNSLVTLGKSLVNKLFNKKVKDVAPKGLDEDALRKEEENRLNRYAKAAAEAAFDKSRDESRRKKTEEEARKQEEEEARKQEEEKARKQEEEEARKKATIEELIEDYYKRLEEKGNPTDVADTISEANSPKSWSELKRKDREYSKDEDQAIINSNYMSTEEMNHVDSKMTINEGKKLLDLYLEHGITMDEYQINCQSCTLAYDMRQRGYDVEAAPYDMDETWHPNIDGLTEWYKDTTTDDWTISRLPPPPPGISSSDPEYEEERNKARSEMYNKIEDTFEEMPDGAYGQFCVYWTSGGGHSIVWEKENGKVTLRDCQTNKTHKFDEIHKNDLYYNYVDSIYVLRTDNREFTDEALKRVRNADHVEEIDTYVEQLRKKYGSD